jgi:hypothetical protein
MTEALPLVAAQEPAANELKERTESPGAIYIIRLREGYFGEK